MNTDPIADLLTRIRNACLVGASEVEIPASTLKVEIVKLLLQEGYIRSYEIREEEGGKRRTLRVLLKYNSEGYSVISKLKRISKPGLRKYFGVDNLPRVLRGAGIAIVSTSKGVMTDRAARKEGVGGEVLCHVE